MLNPPVNSKSQGLFNAFECFSSTFQGNCNFKGILKTVLYIQVLFKPVRTLKQHLPNHVRLNRNLMGGIRQNGDLESPKCFCDDIQNAKFNQHAVSLICCLCKAAVEDRVHFVLECSGLDPPFFIPYVSLIHTIQDLKTLT